MHKPKASNTFAMFGINHITKAQTIARRRTRRRVKDSRSVKSDKRTS
jgi:hypothetical protein